MKNYYRERQDAADSLKIAPTDEEMDEILKSCGRMVGIEYEPVRKNTHVKYTSEYIDSGFN